MKLDYSTFKSAPKSISLVVMFKFLSKTKNASLRPGEIDSDCPPVLYWWFEKNDKAVNQFIASVIESYPWEVPWTLEDCGNNKWLLYPTRIKEAEFILKGDKEQVGTTLDGVEYVMREDPEFGRQANKDLDRFRLYFRKKIENYLKGKERAQQGIFKDK